MKQVQDDGKELSFLRLGRYEWDGGGLGNQGACIYNWNPKANSGSRALALASHKSILDPQITYYKGYGISIRCVVKP